ncbi:hypothetical protein H6786_00365 [Candidatus Nomurabacteria bacterium]|nr:hypothetical protein [Candidatus Nomurabacteria bacterium]
MLRTLGTVFKQPRYILVATLVAVSVFVFAVWLPNVSLIASVLTSNVGTSAEKVTFLFSLLGSLTTNFTVLSAGTTIVVAILFGMNVALLLYYIQKVRVRTSSISSFSGMGVAGVISGFLGVGCAACGTFILSSVLVLIGAGGILVYLPFGGKEFGVIGIALLLVNIHQLLKKINTSLTCETNLFRK